MRRTRALWELNDRKELREGVPGLSRAAQPMAMCAWERIAAGTLMAGFSEYFFDLD